MTAQAKNLLFTSFMLMVMFLAAIMYGPALPGQNRTKSVTVLLPKPQPVNVTFEQREFAQREFECMRLNIFHEAGNQTKRGMEAVALIVLHRAKSGYYSKTICGVVTQALVVNGVVVRNQCAFSWYCDGEPDEPDLSNPLDRKAWVEATKVARLAIDGKIKNFLGKATHYHATYVHPSWANASRFRAIARIGDHIFYRDIKLKFKV